jgi:oligopeptide/dipeptide ABC transporter ATP-binding protein
VTLSNETALHAPEASDTPVLEIEHLNVRLRRGTGTVTILDDVSYTVAHGAAIAIVGESGAGKSVSTRAVLDLLDRRKFDVVGTVVLDGKDTAPMSKRERRRHISSVASLVFQDPTRSLNPTMRVGWQIAEAMYKVEGRGEGIDKEEAKKRTIQLMRDVGIADPEERFFAYPHQLSGGMRQRIVIAIAIACAPKIIFCDEPTSSLDVTTQALIMDLLSGLRETLQVAIVLITHDLSLAASRVDEVIVMYQGRLVERLPSKGLFENAAMPYTQALLRAVPDVAGAIPDPIPSLPFRLRDKVIGCPYNPICERAQDICREETPPLVEISEGHLARCFFPGPSTRLTNKVAGS